jgi:hypothetical protein
MTGGALASVLNAPTLFPAQIIKEEYNTKERLRLREVFSSRSKTR